MTNHLRLTLAVGDYDHMRDLALGRVQPKGIDLTVLNYDVEEIFYRFHDRLEWEVSELSMGMYTSAVSRGDTRFIAIPVFPSRVFRHSALYVRKGGKVQRPEDLKGKRIGVAQWSQTASIYVRGFISDTLGIPLRDIHWVQAGVNDPGRPEPATLRIPPDIKIDWVTDRSMTEMLIAGDLDAMISARPPRAFVEGDDRIRRLYPDYKPVEMDYFRQTGVFPIMHTIAIRRDAYDANRWIARNLMVAFNEAKDRSVARMLDLTAAHVPLPWVSDLAEHAGRNLVFAKGGFWPYGVAPNRTTLDAFLKWGYEQGVCHRHLRAEEIFAEEALAEIKV